MCGRYTIRRIDTIIRFGAMEQSDFEEFDETRIVPRFNVAPSQQVPIVRMTAGDAVSVGLAKWGFIPGWTKGKPKLAPINARSETIADSKMFRSAYNKRRCLLPVDGFYEWRKLDDSAKPVKQPTFIRMKDDAPFAFAGLWETWRNESDETIKSCTILTTTPNELMASIHDRMPVILPSEHYTRWLDPKILGVDVADLLVPCDAAKMEAYPVSTLVNSPRNQGEELIEPA